MKPTRYRVIKPLSVHGRIAGVNEVVRLPEYLALEWIESGHLREITDAALLVNGSGRWVEPMQR